MSNVFCNMMLGNILLRIKTQKTEISLSDEKFKFCSFFKLNHLSLFLKSWLPETSKPKLRITILTI